MIDEFPRINRKASGAFVTIGKRVFYPRALFGVEAANAIAAKLRARFPKSQVTVWRVYDYVTGS